MSVLGQKTVRVEPPAQPAQARPVENVSVKTDLLNQEAEPFNEFIKTVRKNEAKMAQEAVEAKAAKELAKKKAEEDALNDPWARKVYEISQTLSLEDLIFQGFTQAEVEVVPGALWVTYKSVSHDIVNGIMSEALKDTSGEPLTTYENHYAMLMLVHSIASMRTLRGSRALPHPREEKYTEIQSLDANLVRKIIDNHNMFDAAVARLLNTGVVDKLKK